MASPVETNLRRTVNLPRRPFLFTLDQVAELLAISPRALQNFLYYHGRDVGPPRGKLPARNIAPPDQRAEWRIAERDLLIWLRSKGFRVTDPGW